MLASGPAMINHDKNEPEDHLYPSVDLIGDLFGDYADYERLNVRDSEVNKGDQVIDHNTIGLNT
jgi:hypothetical protein